MDLAGVLALFRYNQWANERTVLGVAQAPQAVFSHHLHPLPEGSIQGVLTHIVWSEWIWLQRWKGVTNLVFQPADFALVPQELVFAASDFPDVDAVRQRLEAVGKETFAYLGDLKPGDLDAVVEYRTLGGAVWPRVLWRQLVHAVNHSTYHRGQVAAMLRELGYAPVASDLVGFDDQA